MRPNGGAGPPGVTGRTSMVAVALGNGALAGDRGVVAGATVGTADSDGPGPGAMRAKSPNSVTTARNVAPKPAGELSSGCQTPSTRRATVPSVRSGSAARRTMLTPACPGRGDLHAILVGDDEAIDIAVEVAGNRLHVGRDGRDGHVERLRARRQRQRPRSGEDLGLWHRLGRRDRDQRTLGGLELHGGRGTLRATLLARWRRQPEVRLEGHDPVVQRRALGWRRRLCECDDDEPDAEARKSEAPAIHHNHQVARSATTWATAGAATPPEMSRRPASHSPTPKSRGTTCQP